MSNIIIAAPRISDSARDLARAVDQDAGYRIRCRYVRTDQPRDNGRRASNLVVNWGVGNTDNVRNYRANPSVRVMNSNTSLATNKLTAFNRFRAEGVPHPPFCTSREEARDMLATGATVYCRTALRGHSGEDIVIAREEGEIVSAPLYTQGIEKHHEFRFHVFDGTVIDGVRKAFHSDVPREERNRDIMNHAAGTIFVRSGPALVQASTNQRMMSDCVRAVRALGLDFGAVDVITDRQGNHYILEVNTAPGLVETTLSRYTAAIKNKITNRPQLAWSMQNQETTQQTTQEVQPMNYLVLDTFSGTTLTCGAVYEGAHSPDTDAILIRNNQGRLRPYSILNLREVSSPVTIQNQAATPVVPTAPSLPTGFDVDQPSNSPLRVITLPDNTQVNPGGTLRYVGTSSSILDVDTLYQVSEIRKEADSDRFFVGITINGNLRRWNSSVFGSGTRASEATTNTPAPAPRPAPTVTASCGTALQEGSKVRVITSHGGHGLQANSLGEVVRVNLNTNTVSIRVLGLPNTNLASIAARRVVAVSDNTYTNIERLHNPGSVSNSTIDVRVGDSTYRVRDTNRSALFAVLNRISI